MKELSEWQAARVRDALRAYHRYERGPEGEYFTWKDVREAIEEFTGVKIGSSVKNGAERLRQFVEGVEDGKGTGKRKFPLPQPAALEAIVTFVTSKYSNLLSRNDLKEEIPGFQAFLRLLEYLDDGSDTTQTSPSDKILGRYKFSGIVHSLFFVRELTLQRSDGRGLIQVIETEDRYEKRWDYGDFETWDFEKRREALKSRQRHSGWAVFTPEDNLFFFLKNEKTARNRYLFTMAGDFDLSSHPSYNQIVVLHHDYPFELEPDDSKLPSLELQVAEEMKNNLTVMKKVE